MPDRYSETYGTEYRAADVNFVKDFRPTTLLEQSLNGGYDRTTMPVGEQTSEGAEIQTTGGARITDALDAIRIGAIGRKK